MKIVNIIKAMFVVGQLRVMLNKLWLRRFDAKNSFSQSDNFEWLKNNEGSISEFCSQLDDNLWEAIQDDVMKVCLLSKKKIKEVPFELGGGGVYPLLYFLVRYIKPKTVVETGVASGFSSHAILDALDKNKYGHLYSSDFPYFRLPNPVRFIGIVVPDNLKSRWSLFIEGDKVNLQKISKKISHVDLFHYDSDKSHLGRLISLKILKGKITDNSWVIFDDIQDNSFFHDLINKDECANWKIFEFEGKWVGVTFP